MFYLPYNMKFYNETIKYFGFNIEPFGNEKSEFKDEKILYYKLNINNRYNKKCFKCQVCEAYYYPQLFEMYKDVDDEKLFANLKYFLERIMPVCDKYDIKVESGFENDGFSFVFYRDTHQRHVTQNVTISVTDQDKDAKIPTDARVYLLLKDDPAQTRESLAQKTGRTVRTIQRALDKLSREGRIQRIGSNKTGYWEIF